MSHITQTKLNRAIWRDGVRLLDGKKLPIKRITGYLPAQARTRESSQDIEFMASPGQVVNIRREAVRQGKIRRR